MISIILYGRNDNHGYNYHKRITLGLNSLAEILDEPNDEIIFADCNTPEEFPTIVEAVQDTLSKKAKKLLKLLRIRSTHLQKFKTHLPLLEPVARNVAIRRSHPHNKWILSTNADMILVPFTSTNLSNIVSKLPRGFYQLPRFELPESFWETSLDRLSPEKNISFLRNQSGKLHLRTIVRREGFLTYDNPGDFQLMLREDIFYIGGFDERMVKGWHVDSNLSKRMHLLLKEGGSLEDQIGAFHCNHNRKESLLHRNVHPENDWSFFVSNVSDPILEQKTWGLPHEDIEEIKLETNTYINAISEVLASSQEKNCSITLNAQRYNVLTYPSERIFHYLVDYFYHLPKKINIMYVGYNTRLFDLLTSYLEKIAFTGNFRHAKDVKNLHAEIYIFDFGFDEDSREGKEIQGSYEGYLIGRKKVKKVMKALFKVLRREKKRKSEAKFIGINTQRTDFAPVFEKHLSTSKNGYLTRVIFGSMKKDVPKPESIFKETLKLHLYYLFVRYFFRYTDRILYYLSNKKLAKKFFKK